MADEQGRPSIERVRAVLDYDAGAGALRWKITDRRKRKGTVAGKWHSDGYRYIQLDRKHFGAHRLAWVIVHGVWPPEHVDHINGNRGDNRLGNLRLASISQNNAHKGKKPGCSSNYKGVCKVADNRWVSRITVGGRAIHLGSFRSETEAYATYREAAIKFFGDFAGQL